MSDVLEIDVPDEIYLIYMGEDDGIVWCDSPTPEYTMLDEDAVKYVKASTLAPPKTDKSDSFTYKNYSGSYRIDHISRCFTGKIEFIPDLITFEGSGFNELEKNFKSAVDDYLKLCQSYLKINKETPL